MKFRYSAWDQALADRLNQFKTLKALFNHLLLMTDGDVDQAFRWLEELKRRGALPPDFDLEAFKKQLEEENIIQLEGGEARLTRKGERSIRQSSLDLIFNQLRKGGAGDHRTSQTGEGGENLPESRPFVFGDQMADLNQTATLQSALRNGLDDISITEDDLQVFEKEHRTAVATVLCLDISHSMVLYGEDRITPAKKVAMALTELILTRYPKDSLDVITFGDEAKIIDLEDIPYIQVGPFHTNTKEGLLVARQLLRKHRNKNKQIFMITDGKPSCIREEGRLYKNPYGLDRKIIHQTLHEAAQCRKDGVIISTFMIADDPYLTRFVDTLTKTNKGRAFYAGLNDLGQYIFVDYIKNRRKNLR